ncbi:hypothetical protein HQ563_14115 [bacterium]|nr:hypothetical protein [bacterium]
MSFEEFAWRTFVLAAVNGVFMWLAIKLLGFWNERNRLTAAILWSIPISVLIHVGFRFGGMFCMFGLWIFYAAVLKWYDLEIWQTLEVVFVTLILDVATYIALTRIGILPPFPTAAVALVPAFG